MTKGSQEHKERSSGGPARPAGVPARSTSNEADPGGLRALQRSAGNRAVTIMVQRQTTHAKAPEAVRAIPSYAGIDDAERLLLMNVLLERWYVTDADENALARIWGALDEEGLVRFVAAHPGKWEECSKRGANLLEIKPYRDIQTHFRNDISAVARHHLKTNEDLVDKELKLLGTEAAVTTDQAGRVAEMQAVAAALANLQRAQEAAKEARVGWRIGDGGDVDPDWTGRKVKYSVPFQPGVPPPLTEEPRDVPNGDLFAYKQVPYDQVLAGYDAAAHAITDLVRVNPSLYGLIRDGKSANTEGFVTEKDPAAARERLTKPLRQVLTDINTTRSNLGGPLDPLDLQPLLQQLYDGRAPVGGALWTGGFRRQVATSTAVGHNIERALTRAALQKVQQLAFLFAPFTEGASLLILLGVGTAAAGATAYGSNREAQVIGAAEGSSVKPGTELVTPGSAAHARMTAEADLVAFALASLALGTSAFAAWRAGANARRAAVDERIRLHHGTDAAGAEALVGPQGARIDVTFKPGTHQDLGRGFYATLDHPTAAGYAVKRAAQRGGAAAGRVVTFEVRRSDLGVVVDVRKGGNFRAQWETYLNERPPFPGGYTPAGMETNRSFMIAAPESRGVVFDRFLQRHGVAGADTVIAPLGESPFTGIVGQGVTDQVCIRTQTLADKLNKSVVVPAAP